MDEQVIRRIVREEIAKTSSSKRFDVQNIPYHTHNGIDSPRVNESSLVQSTSVSGSITFEQTTQYTLQLNANFTPSNILAYGIVVDSASSPTVRCISVGSANAGPAFYFQPGGSTFVVTGGPQQDIIQSSTYFAHIGGTSTRALTSEGHIVSIEYGGSIHARATVLSFSKSGIVIDVPFLDSGWSIIVNYVVT